MRVPATLLLSLCTRASPLAVRPALGAARWSRAAPSQLFASVSGPVYTADDEEAPTVTLFTKEGCTLCDKVGESPDHRGENWSHAPSPTPPIAATAAAAAAITITITITAVTAAVAAADCRPRIQVKDTLREVSTDVPHSMVAVDITDAEHEKWFGMYKYDIPVLHLNGVYVDHL